MSSFNKTISVAFLIVSLLIGVGVGYFVAVQSDNKAELTRQIESFETIVADQAVQIENLQNQIDTKTNQITTLENEKTQLVGVH